ncbi:MAG: hypothetical protein ACRCY0_07600 [Synechococcus elongatus]|nr:hypothetical protein M744_02800 [Synechococcus elongatus UTEX 2973]
MELTRHAIDKLETYGIQGDRFQSWLAALPAGEVFQDLTSGAVGLVVRWEERPWIVILSEDRAKVVTTYPTDERAVTNRRGGGRWIFLNS